MKEIAILTATYNHPARLAELYASLCAQEDRDFTWIAVDDGSRADTGALMEGFVREGRLDMIAVRQENGGKSKAVNHGLDHLTPEARAVVIVDDDETLRPDAVATVRRYLDRYAHEGCGVIHFNRMNEKGEVIADPAIDEDFFMSYQEFKSRGRWADGYICYLTGALGSERFHIYEGEKYIAPSSLFMRVTEHSRLLWAAAVLGDTEYLEGGITKQGRRLRVRNPRGMIEYCGLMQRGGAGLKTRAAYSVQAYAYREFLTDRASADMSPFMSGAKLPGRLLAAHWKRKFAKQG